MGFVGEGEKGDFAWFGTLIKDYIHDHKIKILRLIELLKYISYAFISFILIKIITIIFNVK
jgi:hypothetical protein